MATQDYKIIGMDPERPPRIQRQPCIDLVFELDEEPTSEWINEFGSVTGKSKYTVAVDSENPLYIATWVRKPQEIQGHLNEVKSMVRLANTNNAERARKAVGVVVTTKEETISPEQEALNGVVAKLDFE